ERGAASVMVYFSANGEVDLGNAIDSFLGSGKKVLAPKVSGPEILPVQIASRSDLKPGFKGILEPGSAAAFTEAIDVIFVPGLAFDEEHFRLGYGGGYYDRFLAAHRGSFTVGCFYASQFFSELPVEDHDRPLQCIVTEDGIQ
ncbi:MAG: 5-formyltetrahydrofolate cyclo-ligase, partial [Spirochaetia bacterium]|nr:5-formyltetrahydrofolate cyclo-ligase [Spirochaetia bacterium]